MDGGNLDTAPAETVDGELLLAAEARTTARRYYLAGFFLLPWFWATNIWLFFPHWKAGGDPVIKHYLRRSALWFVAYTCLLLPWTLTYYIGGPRLLGRGAYDALDVTQLDLAGAGFGG